MSDLPEPQLSTGPQGIWRRPSLVWLVPIAALLITLFLVFSQYRNLGPVIDISFDNATGIKVGETEVRYRDVKVGTVENIRFSEDLTQVIASVRLDKNVARFIDKDSQFWVVRPKVTARGITGLGTVLTGVYIEGSWDNTPGPLTSVFEGLDGAPLVRPDRQGLYFQLISDGTSGLGEGTPILYKGVEVGTISNMRLSNDGTQITADAFVNAPHHQLINSETRFWEDAGYSFNLSPSGVDFDVKSIAALIAGGISFESFVSGGISVDQGASFTLFEDEDIARGSVFEESIDGRPVPVAIIFSGEYAGLSVGAPVEYRGVKVGEVAFMTGIVDTEKFGDKIPRLKVTVQVSPGKLGLPAETQPQKVYTYLDDLAALGVKAQLRTANILTGGVKIVLTTDEVPSMLAQPEDGLPVLPALKAELTDISASASGVMDRINNLPIEELLNSAINLLDSTNRLIGSEDLQKAPAEALAMLGDIRNLTGSDPIKALPGQISLVMKDMQTAMGSLNKIFLTIEQEKAVAELVSAIKKAGETAESLKAASNEAPKLMNSLNDLVNTAKDLPYKSLVERTTALLETAEKLFATDDAKKLPASLNSALSEVSLALAEMREGGVVTNLNETLSSSQKAADELAKATKNLPALVASINQVLRQAENTLASYGEGSHVSNDARAMLREFRNAAKALTSLAKAIERRPNSLLIGK